MSLVVKNLETKLQKVFSDMKSAGENAKDTDFSDGVSKACKDFIEAGSIKTTDAGTISAGVFKGDGKGSISLTDSLMSAPIVIAMTSMKTMTSGGDSILATAIFSGLSAMVTAGKVETNVSGTVTNTSSGATSPMAGSAKGVMACSYPTFVTELNKIFSDMKDKDNGDDYLAEKLASLVDSYTKTGIVTTAGTDTIAGSAGGGNIS